MSTSIPHLLPIEKTHDDRRREVLSNLIKMLTNRGLLDKSNLDKNIKSITNEHNDNMMYNISLDYPSMYYNKDNKTMFVKIISQKISGMAKNSIMREFLSDKKDKPKILIVKSITPKIIDDITDAYPNTEIFMEHDLMIDIVSHICVPAHELLSNDDGVKLLNEYSFKKKELPKMLADDPMAKYYNAKIGQIFRIIRPSEVAGQSVYYRLVVGGSIAKK